MNRPRIILYSNPLVSTWVLHDTLRILFDAGDGVSSHLDARVHRVRMLALTHAHRDHCAGLMQFLNLRGEAGDFITLFPDGSTSCHILTRFLTGFDARSTSKVTFQPIGAEESVAIMPERHMLQTFETEHYLLGESPKPRSLGYRIVRVVNKLLPQYADLPKEEIARLGRDLGSDHITEPVHDTLFAITGDTRPLPPSTFKGARILLHEATALTRTEQAELSERGHPHSTIEDAIECAVIAGVGHLGLYHISRRYEYEVIIECVRQLCRKQEVPFPVSVALPGRVYEDFLADCAWHGMERESS